MKLADRISSLLLAALSIFFFVEARDFSRLSGLFPRIVLMILAALSLLQFVLTFFRKGEDVPFDAAAFRHIPTLLSLVMMIAWAMLIPVLGFLTSSLIFFTLLTLYLDRDAPGRKKVKRALTALTVTLGFWLFFSRVLYVHFPTGLLI